MPLNNSGPISIGGSTAGQSINLELGRAATASSNLNESALRTLAGVPSGAISLSNFYGKSNFTANLPDYVGSGINLSQFFIASGAASREAGVEIVLNSNGTGAYRRFDNTNGTVNLTTFTWLTGGGSSGDYYAHMANPSGSSFTSSSPTNTALALSTGRIWTLQAVATLNTSDYRSLTSTLQIRTVDGTVLVSRSVSMEAEVINGIPP